MKTIKLILNLITAAVLLFLTSPGLAEDHITVPYVMTFDCPESQFNNQFSPPVCNHLPGAYQSYNATDGHYSQITSAANFPNGGGGRGHRTWVGEVVNDYSSPISYEFQNNQGGTAVSEFWARFYIRWQPGFTWGTDRTSGQKVLYMGSNSQALTYFNWANGFVRVSDGVFIRVNNNFGVTNFWNANGTSFSSDGSWHCSEIHFKGESPVGAKNGIAEWWIDNVQRLSAADVPYGYSTIQYFALLSNGNANANGTTQWIDVDDVSISTTGRVGCPYNTGAIAPQPPQNLQVK